MQPDALPRETSRLRLLQPDPDAAPRVCDFHRRNRDHHGPWDPPRAPNFYQVDGCRELLAENRRDFAAGRSLKLFMERRDNASIIGSVNFTNFVRGPFLACNIGYAGDLDHEGQGYMSEALRAAIEVLFGPLGFHRVMANYRPENIRSAFLLKRLGFAREGYARDYLFIDGAWRDHILTSLTNPSPVRP